MSRPPRPALSVSLLLFALFCLLALLPPPAAAADAPARPEGRDRPARERARHREILAAGTWDVLVVPFQTERNGFDRAARSLMTRYLDDRLRRGGSRTPSNTLVARALGEGSRTFGEADLFRLANDMKVRTLVVSVAGHGLDEKLHATLAFYTLPDGGTFSAAVAPVRVEFRDVPFSDENPPEEAFRAALDGRLRDLPLRAAAPAPPAAPSPPGKLDVPTGLGALCEAEDPDPVERAFRLQLLALLAPRDGTLRETLFERSLLAAQGAPASAPELPLLRARALFHLHRRPASVALLAAPKSPEERAFAALQDGDLAELGRRVREIGRPLPRLVAELEENDLRWKYDESLPLRQEYDNVCGRYPGLGEVLSLRLSSPDGWTVPPVLRVKDVLDNAFPVEGYTARGLAAAQLLQKRSPFEGEEVDLSVENHRDRLYRERGASLFAGDDTAGPVGRDALDLLQDHAEAALMKRMRLRTELQGLPDAALDLCGTLDPPFQGDPLYSLYKARALWNSGRLKQAGGRKEAREQAKALAAEAFPRVGEQNQVSNGLYVFLKEGGDDMAAFPTYDHDSPRRPVWYGRSKEGDRTRCSFPRLAARNAATLTGFGLGKLCARGINLLYAEADFSSYKDYYDQLVKEGGDGAGDGFLAATPRRFAGHRNRPAFLAGIREKRGDEAGARAVFEEALVETPGVWEPRHQYAHFRMRRGDLKGAFDLLVKYPPFAGKELPPWANGVAEGNHAWTAGNDLLQRGAIGEGAELLKVAASFDTGSSAEMRAKRRLACLDGRMGEAFTYSLEEFRRYENTEGTRDYLSLLFLVEPTERGWLVFDSIVGKADGKSEHLWTAVETGLRREGRDPEAVASWFGREAVRKAAGSHLPIALLLALTTDRPPDPSLPARIRDVRAAPDGEEGKPQKTKLVDVYAEGYLLARQGKAQDAFALFRDRGDFFRKNSTLFGLALPYAARGAVAAGRTAELEPLLVEKEEGFPFSVSLARAVLSGARGEHGKAVEQLRKAAWNRPGIRDGSSHPLYELLEHAEWLYEATKEPAYRAFLLEWARIARRVDPTLSWAYAFEARHADAGSDRTRALGMALYMDPRSERIASVPEEEKEKAREWLARNNPFAPRKREPKGA